MESLDPKRLKRYFKKNENAAAWEVKPSIRDMVTFQHHNILDRLRQPTFDCIFIRNVLIYFDRVSKQRAVDNLINSMAANGYLVVGRPKAFSRCLSH